MEKTSALIALLTQPLKMYSTDFFEVNLKLISSGLEECQCVFQVYLRFFMSSFFFNNHHQLIEQMHPCRAVRVMMDFLVMVLSQCKGPF